MKNMKIAVTAEQPLDEIVAELEKRGYRRWRWNSLIYTGCIRSFDDGTYSNFETVGNLDLLALTSLTELKEM